MAPQMKRTQTAQDEILKQWGGGRSTHWVLPPDGLSVLEIQTTHNPAEFKDVPVADNYLVPPYHWHWKQTEYFEIQSGRYIFTLEGVETTKDASSGKITVPPTARHTFRPDPTSPEPCTIHISTNNSPHGMDERFFRNIYSYLDDCGQQGEPPSVPQLLLFLHDAEVSLAFPGPAWLMRQLGYAMGLVVGVWWGKWVCGMQASYTEYFDEKMVKRA